MPTVLSLPHAGCPNEEANFFCQHMFATMTMVRSAAAEWSSKLSGDSSKCSRRFSIGRKASNGGNLGRDVLKTSTPLPREAGQVGSDGGDGRRYCVEYGWNMK